MNEQGYGVLEAIVSTTDSGIILFFVIVAVIAIPLYVASSRRRKADKAHEIQREGLLLEVVKENTAVISGLKVTLDTSKIDTKATLDRIHTRVDEQNATTSNIATDVARISTKLDTTLANHTELASKVNKIMLIVVKNNGEN